MSGKKKKEKEKKKPICDDVGRNKLTEVFVVE